MNKSEPIFKLFANCLPVKGARRSIICDLQLRKYDLIPNGLYYILTELKGLSVERIKDAFDPAKHRIIDEYFEFLEKKEYGFFCDEPDLFPDLDLKWMAPGQITNAIIDVNQESHHPFESIFAQLDSLGCKAVQLRFFSIVSPTEVRRILQLTGRGGLRHIDLLMPYSPEFSDDILSDICYEHQRVSKIMIHSAPSCRTIRTSDAGVLIIFTTTQCDSPDCCGQTLPKHFAVNIEHFTEAQEWNTCLNRKVSISADGYIKNCPSMSESFGHVSSIPLISALAAPHFKDVWGITKDQIKVCRDCEFRYICTDCRAYREDPTDMASKPLKCGYDPYSAEWRKPDGVIRTEQ